MKLLKIFILVLFASLSSFAQDPQLLDNNWYFSSGELNENELVLPYPSFNSELHFSLESFTLAYPECEEYTTGELNYDNDTFDLVGGPASLIGFCSWEFIFEHFSVYYDDNDMPKNTFNYTIEGVEPNLTLTVYNGNGDFAIYNNNILANSDFLLNTFTFYPNPVDNILQITSQNNLSIKKIRVFDISGKLVLEEKGDINQLDLTGLNSGILFVQIETDEGSLVKKVIKK